MNNNPTTTASLTWSQIEALMVRLGALDFDGYQAVLEILNLSALDREAIRDCILECIHMAEVN